MANETRPLAANARVLLAVIRLFNGMLGLFLPRVIVGQFGS